MFKFISFSWDQFPVLCKCWGFCLLSKQCSKKGTNLLSRDITRVGRRYAQFPQHIVGVHIWKGKRIWEIISLPTATFPGSWHEPAVLPHLVHVLLAALPLRPTTQAERKPSSWMSLVVGRLGQYSLASALLNKRTIKVLSWRTGLKNRRSLPACHQSCGGRFPSFSSEEECLLRISCFQLPADSSAMNTLSVSVSDRLGFLNKTICRECHQKKSTKSCIKQTSQFFISKEALLELHRVPFTV